MSEAAPAAGRDEIWIEKYRPRHLSDVLGQDDIVSRLSSYVERDDLPNLLFAGPAGVGKCVTGETPILTNRGVEQIEDVVGDADGFDTPREGLEVLTYDENGGFRYVKPSHVFRKEVEDGIRVETRDGNELTATPEHPLLVLDHGGLRWKRADELEPGDRLARPLRAPLPTSEGELDWITEMDGERTFVHVTDEFARKYEIPVEEDFVGKKKDAVASFRVGAEDSAIATDLSLSETTVRMYRNEVADRDLDEPGTVCSLSYLRSLDVTRAELKRNVLRIQYVSRYNARSAPIVPPWTVTPSLATFLGLVMSEARITGSTIKFYNTDSTLLDEFDRTAAAVFDADITAGEQHGVPYRAIGNRTITHFLESCFDSFASAMGDSTVGSAMLRADEESKAAFLRAMFDAEAHVTEHGIVELTQRRGELITLLSYLLAGFGIPSRRKTACKAATNGSGTEREYHVLYVSGARDLRRFQETVGFSNETKAARLEANADRRANPNYDTIPVQRAVDVLCEELYLPKGELTTDTLNPDTPGRERYLDDVERTLDAATAKLETVQTVLEQIEWLATRIDAVSALPATWARERRRLNPIETRHGVSDVTGVREDYLLEYADGRRTHRGRRIGELLVQLGSLDRRPPTESIQSQLREAIDRLGVPYNHIAQSTKLRGTAVIDLLENTDHDVVSLSRFATIADRVQSIAAKMASSQVLSALVVLDTLARGDLYFDEVREVQRETGALQVFDLTVPETHNFVGGGVPTVMHNTTAAHAIAHQIYGDDWQENFLELNASDERGIDVVRDRIKNFARASFGGHDYRIIFLDEADSLCVPPGTEVVTGYPSKCEVKPIEDVSETGEPIPSVDFETNEIQSDKGKLVDSGIADFFEVKLEDGREIVASLSHPFFVVGPDGQLIERELQDLKLGDEIADFRDDIGLSLCECCGAWTTGRFCSIDCKNEGHSGDMQGDGELPHHEHYELEDFDPALVFDGGRRAVSTVKVSSIEYSHRGKAYNISMEATPNFILANGILTHNTSDAQSALRRTMEQFSHNTRFILSCNYSSRIIDPIQSRCAVFRFSPIPDAAVAERIREIAEAEGIEVTDDGVDALVYAADGDMRKAINALQAAGVLGETVDEDAVYTITSTARPEEIEAMVTKALAGEFVAARAMLAELLTEKGLAGGDVIDQLHRSVWEFDLEDEAAVRLLDRIGEADYRIAEGANERVQLEALLAAVALSAEE